MATSNHSLIQHIKAVKKRQRRLRAPSGSVPDDFRGGIEKVTVNGKPL
jgi:hypothetical protein